VLVTTVNWDWIHVVPSIFVLPGTATLVVRRKECGGEHAYCFTSHAFILSPREDHLGMLAEILLYITP
jgi:hypothetical protein